MIASSRIIQANVGTFLRLARILPGLLALALIFDSATPIDAKHRSQSTVVTVWYNPGGPVNRFAPSHALGAAIDGHLVLARRESHEIVASAIICDGGPLRAGARIGHRDLCALDS